MRLSEDQAQQMVRSRAADEDNINITLHAYERMEERGFIDIDIHRILQRGHIDDAPEPGENEGEWMCKVTYKLKGQREAGVITVIMLDGTLLVVTVEWEDIS